MTPPDNAPPIVYQVFLGCKTPTRLANELCIHVIHAAKLLRESWKRGEIERVSVGVYEFKEEVIGGVCFGRRVTC